MWQPFFCFKFPPKNRHWQYPLADRRIKIIHYFIIRYYFFDLFHRLQQIGNTYANFSHSNFLLLFKLFRLIMLEWILLLKHNQAVPPAKSSLAELWLGFRSNTEWQRLKKIYRYTLFIFLIWTPCLPTSSSAKFLETAALFIHVARKYTFLGW